MEKKKEKIPVNAVGKIIKEAREKEGLRAIDLVWKINDPNITLKVVKRWESGQEFPDLDMIYKLSGMFNLNPNEMLKLKTQIQEESYIDPNPVLRRFGGAALDSSGPVIKMIIMWAEIILVIAVAFMLKDFMAKMLDPNDPEQIQIIEGAIEEGINTFVE